MWNLKIVASLILLQLQSSCSVKKKEKKATKLNQTYRNACISKHLKREKKNNDFLADLNGFWFQFSVVSTSFTYLRIDACALKRPF